MTRDARPEESPSGPERVDNGLHAAAYVPLLDLDAGVGDQVLIALGRARIAAYLASATQAAPPVAARRRLFVASDDRMDARTVVSAVLRGTGVAAEGGAAAGLAELRDPLDEVDTRASFEALVAGWHIDTVAAVRDAERDLSREDADWRSRLNRSQARDETWLDEDHYVPPVPPPLPRLAGPTVLAMSVLAISIIVLGIGGRFGLASGLTFVLGICGLLLGVGLLFSRLREHNEDDDDGAAL